MIRGDEVGAGPEHPKKRWGLFSEEITADEAARLYSLDAVQREAWFGVLLLGEGRERPSAYLQMCPRANGVELHKLNEHGSVEAAYTWRAYYSPSDSKPYDGDEPRVFLSAITWYVYPEEERFYMRNASLGNVSMVFGVDGYGKEEQVTKRGFGEPADVETREFRDVDVSANWFEIPSSEIGMTSSTLIASSFRLTAADRDRRGIGPASAHPAPAVGCCAWR